MEYKVLKFLFGSAEYKKALELRYRVLRKPLGLQFTAAELSKDVKDIHLGILMGDEIIACLILLVSENKKIKMRQVAVDENFQGKGWGKKLSLAAEEIAKQLGCNCIFCHARKPAVSFYEKLGYKITGDEFTEVGIPHYAMEKQIGGNPH